MTRRNVWVTHTSRRNACCLKKRLLARADKKKRFSIQRDVPSGVSPRPFFAEGTSQILLCEVASRSGRSDHTVHLIGLYSSRILSDQRLQSRLEECQLVTFCLALNQSGLVVKRSFIGTSYMIYTHRNLKKKSCASIQSQLGTTVALSSQHFHH